jgi:ribosomal protein L11 methyltransferase
VPYRVDLRTASADAVNGLIELGALDIDALPGSGVAALMPDAVRSAEVARMLGVDRVDVSPAVGRDADSVWVLRPRPVRVGPRELALADGPAFGTGLHPTTSLCLDALPDTIDPLPATVLDVGTGSGILALAALLLGVPRARAIDIDEEALRAAADNARLNGLDARLDLSLGGPDSIPGSWPLVVANVLAAPLIDMAPVLVQRVSHHGQLVLSGIPDGVAADVDRVYRRLGMHHVRASSRGGWTALVLRASW